MFLYKYSSPFASFTVLFVCFCASWIWYAQVTLFFYLALNCLNFLVSSLSLILLIITSNIFLWNSFFFWQVCVSHIYYTSDIISELTNTLFCYFKIIFFSAFESGKVLLTYPQGHWYFPCFCPVYWWFYHRHSYLLEYFYF